MIEIKNLCKNFGKKQVLKNINLKIEKGEIFAIIGPTGVGKTTLLRILDLLEEPTSGEIYFNNVEITKNKKIKLNHRRKMAVVFQKPIVFKTSVYENIAYGLRVRGEDENLIKKKVKEILEKFSLIEYENRNAETLSGGEIQRICIARAMIIQPEVLLLDEPTANLDPKNIEMIENFLRNKNKNTTIIIATHDMEQCQNIADRVAVLINGEIVQVGRIDEVFRKPENEFVANFIGIKNVFSGVAEVKENLTEIKVNSIALYSTNQKTGNVRISVKPEDILLSKEKQQTTARNVLRGKISEIKYKDIIVQLTVDCGIPFVVVITREAFLEMNINIGEEVYIYFKARNVHLF